ncbi:sulfite exporter TauE/SafE family protein [Paraneptunicella aestuarii]|uniref:sulfite exporter TauE/SafE family protein n=1 Tax=Paraneptunicella aestuarii TaxID=2831148 RepID=UPI001E499F3C|nr:sulfite exporter TauE/SafE family protein [Paraneptunicella aestuarii]UAA37126.1 sulfite exporter TauE/SafE family protein [Paraneptunicella aestuarii]
MIEQYLPIVLSLAAAGVFAGLLAGLFGVGGGIVIVPVLFFLFQSMGVSPESAMGIATATSLACIVPTSISSIRSHHKKGNVDFQLFKQWLPAIFVGVFIGSWLVTRVPGTWFTILFGVIATLSALNMLFRTAKSAIASSLPGKFGQAIIASCIGAFSSMIGIGGGTLSVPILTACSYPAHKAVGTAAAIGLAISLPGAITMLILGTAPEDAPFGTLGLVNFPGLACIIPLSVLCAPLGANLASKLDSNVLKKLFAVLLLLTGLRMLAQLLL